MQTACTPDGRFAFASLYDTKEVVRYEMSSGALVRIPLPADAQGPVQIYPSPYSASLYVCDQGVLLDRPASNKLYVVDVQDAAVIGTVDVGMGAHGVVVSEDGERAFVTNIVDGTVSVVDTVAQQVVETITVGAKPNGVSHLHVGGGMP